MRIAWLLMLMQGQPWNPVGEWRATAFKDAGEVLFQKDVIVLSPGHPMTGITRSTPGFPVANYELRYEAQRRRGNDFFAAVTFPVNNRFLTFINGGWGGDIIGLSSIDNANASENETRAYFNFENHRWYRFRIEVRPERVRVWIDDERVVDANLAGREIGLRPGDTKLMAPLGFASYATEGAIRGIGFRRLP